MHRTPTTTTRKRMNNNYQDHLQSSPYSSPCTHDDDCTASDFTFSSPFEALLQVDGACSLRHSTDAHARAAMSMECNHRRIQGEIYQTFHDTFQQSCGTMRHALLQVSVYRLTRHVPQSLCACAMLTAYVQYVVERYLLRYIDTPLRTKRDLEAGLRQLCDSCGDWIHQVDRDALLDHLKITLWEQLFQHSQALSAKASDTAYATWQPELNKGLRRRVRQMSADGNPDATLPLDHCVKFFHFIFPATLSILYNTDVFDELNFTEWQCFLSEELESDQSTSSSGHLDIQVIHQLYQRIQTNVAALESTQSLMQWLQDDDDDDDDDDDADDDSHDSESDNATK